MYAPDPYRFPAAGRGVTESYVKYQMYSNTPGYNTHMSQYGYDNGSNSMVSLTCEYHILSALYGTWFLSRIYYGFFRHQVYRICLRATDLTTQDKCYIPLGSETRISQLVFPRRKSGCSEFPTWKYDFRLQWNDISYWETRKYEFPSIYEFPSPVERSKSHLQSQPAWTS